LAC
jgi:hypothetical protein